MSDELPVVPNPSVEKLVMHLDMDAFFAAVEQRDHPEYRGLPVVVGARPGTRGVVSTCSYEARAFGVHSAMPISEAFRLCPQAVYLRPEMRRYLAVSKQVMEILATISPVVEPVSIDEAYLDITGLERLFGSPEDIGRLAKRRITSALDLTASVGIGPNRLVAKLASDFRKPDGLTVVRASAVQDFLDPLPVGKLAGVGAVLQARCQALGIRTIGDLRALGLAESQRLFGEKGGLSLHERSRGVASASVGEQAARKSISREFTFEKDVRDERVVHDTLLQLASDVGRMARGEGVGGLVVTVKIRLAGFETHSRQRRLTGAINSDRMIFSEGWRLCRASGLMTRPIRLIGIGLTELRPASEAQARLFVGAGDRKETRLFDAVDRIRSRHGERSIHLGPAPAGDPAPDRESDPIRARKKP
jgi:DNA polymerase-4